MKSSIRKSFVAGTVIVAVLLTFILLAGIKIPLTIFKSQIEQAAGNLIHPTESGVPFMTVDVHSHGLNIDDLIHRDESGGSASTGPLDENRAAPIPDETVSESDKETGQKILAILTKQLPALKLLNVADIDLVLQLAQMILHGESITDVHVDPHLRGGKIIESPFSANMGGTEVRGVVDLWAVNILSAALPAVMKGSESEINCLAADFTFNDGMITPEAFLLDTNRMRVQGNGYLNLKDESIEFSMKPTPKPQFFSLANPVNVTGTIRDFHIGVSAGSVIGTIFRFVSSVVTAPLQKIFTENMAEDGAEACSATAWVVEKQLISNTEENSNVRF